MTRICAWCSTILGTIDDGDDRVSHGICPACSAKLEPEEDEVITIGNEYRYTGKDWGMNGYRVKVVGVFVKDDNDDQDAWHVETDPTNAPPITRASAVEVVGWQERERRWIFGTAEVDARDLEVIDEG